MAITKQEAQEIVGETGGKIPESPTHVTNVYHAAEIHPLILFDGRYQLAGLFWLCFVAVIFLILLRVIPADTLSGSAAGIFFIIAALVSFAGYKND